jgi:hypothetical protein
MDDREAVTLQIVLEASQSSRDDVPATGAPAEASAEPSAQGSVQGSVDIEIPVELAKVNDTDMEGDENMGENVDHPQPLLEEEIARVPEKSSVEKIMEALRGSLQELRTASLSRGEVYEVEDILMDMKRELYGAEARGRN